MPPRPASSHRLSLVLVGMIVLGLGSMIALMRNPGLFRGALPPTQTSRSAGIVISTADFVTAPVGTETLIYIAGFDRDRPNSARRINGVVQTEDVLTDAPIPTGATLERCIYQSTFGSTVVNVSMYCLRWTPVFADVASHTIVLRSKEYGTGTPSDTPLELTLTVTGTASSSSSSSSQNGAQLSVTQVASPTAARGGNIRTVYSISNTGNASATHFQLRVPVPNAPGITFNPTGSDATCAIAGSEIVCGGTNLTVPPGSGFFNVTINYAVSFGATCSSTFTSSALATADGIAPFSINTMTTSVTCTPTNPYCCFNGGVCAENAGCPMTQNQCLTTCGVSSSSSSSSSSQPAGPNLVVTASASPTAARGGNIRTTYSISNTGTADATNVRLRTAVPTVAGITFNPVGSDPSCAISGTDIVCGPALTLAPNAGSFSFIINYAVSFGATCPSTFLRNATVTSENPALALAPTLSTSVTCTPTNPYCCFSGLCAENEGCPMTQNQCLTTCGVSSSSSSSSSSVVTALCGDGVVNGTEECDDGKQCASFGTACTSNADCAGGQTCQTWDGDGCFANCSLMFPPDSIFP